MLRKILDSHNVFYYLVKEENSTLIFLYLPYKRFKTLGEGYLKIDAYYLASNELYHTVKELKNELKNYGVTEITEDIKSVFEKYKIGVRLKNTLISINPFGSTVALAVLKVVLPIEENILPLKLDICLDCENCVRDCPVNALQGGFIREKCLRHGQNVLDGKKYDYTLLDNSILGCDKCQITCPLNSIDRVDMPQDLKELLKKDNFIEKAEKGKKELKVLEDLIGKNMVRLKRLLFFSKYAK